LTVEDVKAFLTWLAVKKDVAASSQNQAFNALLFVFRHVLDKEFGKVDGIVRAKRKPYIPVVLSREEVDMQILTIHDGKGKKDRTVPIPDALMDALKIQLNRVVGPHERDCRAGYAGDIISMNPRCRKHCARQ
jgi:site-specific recombinase XerD